MRKVLAVAFLATALSGLSAAPALAQAGPTLPDPSDCHSMNEFLHIQNVRDCNDPTDY